VPVQAKLIEATEQAVNFSGVESFSQAGEKWLRECAIISQNLRDFGVTNLVINEANPLQSSNLPASTTFSAWAIRLSSDTKEESVSSSQI
jgi:hypothetical protein